MADPLRPRARPARRCRSRPKTSAISAPDSGSSSGSSRPAPPTTVTLRSEAGEDLRQLRADRAAAEHDDRLPAPARSRSPRGWSSTACRASPGMGGMSGAVPVAMTIPRRARSTSPPTVTSPGAVIRPYPRNSVPPLPVNRSAATVSSQLSVASSLIRVATGAQLGEITVELPAMPGMRRPSASRSAALIIILDGTQPQYGHSPPTSLASTPATASPASASLPHPRRPGPCRRPRHQPHARSLAHHPRACFQGSGHACGQGSGHACGYDKAE